VGKSVEEGRTRGEYAVVVAGAAEEATSDEVDEGAARALAVALLEEGFTPSRAAKEIARRLKVSRNLSYGVVQEVAGEAREGDAGDGPDAH
jgi:16S rRNA C1402 (ribose-2'-O) methylase RsmI